MIPYERKKAILTKLNEQDIVTLDELQKILSGVSVSTIRRDLKDLEKVGHVTLLPGGAAKLFSRSTDIPITKRTSLNRNEKKEIALLAVKEVKLGETIYVDSGSTGEELLLELVKKKITLITSVTNFKIPFHDVEAQVYSLGGFVNFTNSSLKGDLAVQNIEYFNFDRAFIGANGVDAKFGYTTPDLGEAIKKRKVIEKSQEVYFVCDSSKFHKVYMSSIAPLSDSVLITDEGDEVIKEDLKQLIC
ncbi:DeoR/GlpR transcriptional regulator [Desemzia sp. RIT804]|uniref:DeoR/GlpR family DNA-binding transcription regulator n=1 Tax=Desemzia sp. RIT 804 TaxID=2810209 RepID=UPI00194ED3AF|nr:DeoR/GlpR family DNA-binding transcription regulator [Desemzia sp. RIT 804]MBM6615312.1 DeoR/GlpR transcriptional regulator [Desemzia sp. RIT 804]